MSEGIASAGSAHAALAEASAGEPAGTRPAASACPECARRSWLLAQLSGVLERCARDPARLLELLALEDGQLLAALAGRRADSLRASYAQFPLRRGSETGEEGEAGRGASVQSTCRHRPGYPRALAGQAAPRMLEVAGGVRRLEELTRAPAVAILGSGAPSDYGIETARSLARGLCASGLSVVAGLRDGIAAAAHAGAVEAGGASVAVMAGGLRASCPARGRSLYERVLRAGCAVSELPPDCNGRRWGQLASERIVVELAQVTVLVEAGDSPGELAAARHARALGRALAAIPGRVTSPLSRGPHALLAGGASLVRGARDVLELAYPPDASAAAPGDGEPDARVRADLRADLRETLERVGAGADTPDMLARSREDSWELLSELSELELMGLLVRGDGGRYVPRQALP
ncbi:MAG TPA: DNA-processing protein DprA [Solirubrobacteraceae bacterium]|nr:DNA-processing protein DprA [Solirubrobacteraceae bacterium]